MHNTWIVFKKEMARFFKDFRLFFSTVIFPGLLLFIVYNVIGVGLQSFMQGSEDYIASVYTVNYPETIRSAIEIQDPALKITITAIEEDEIVTYRDLVRDQEVDLLMVFEDDFDAKYADVINGVSGAEAPYAKLYYNSTRTESSSVYTQIKAIIDHIEEMATPDLINLNEPVEIYDQATERDIASFVFSSLFPFLILIFISSGVVGLTAESIAGEKERGTLATVLVTPIRRGEYAVGKILALAVEALLSGLSSFIAVLLSFPQLAGLDGGFSLVLSSFKITDYLGILLMIIALVLFVVTLMSIASAFARTVKEASSYSAPILMLLMVIGVTPLLTQGGAATNALIYLIPIIGPLQALVGIFSFSSSLINILLAFGSTLVYATLLAFVLVKMFNNERVMFKQ